MLLPRNNEAMSCHLPVSSVVMNGTDDLVDMGKEEGRNSDAQHNE